ncbi:hypothetical protein GSI_04163 [Ganoderma sinense ZZ0214-1]|uniref:Uncharacterized protein n=1 Tax=Ganoderma sinense ZZ0214-1 TaxID=1077348 RepID=A0A2G8SIF9_9APHY|nr:hypothetical protein GSI_04163 [Ganoderma sinense ZZ0214-1]
MSSNSTTHEFPVPVGGVPYPLDFAPSILFAVLYGFMVPVVVYRMVHPRSRNGVLIGTTVFSIERVVSYGLRAHAAYSASARASEDLETYFQTTYSGGFTSIGQDLMQLFRALLVSSTLGGDMVALHNLTPPLVFRAQTRRRDVSEEVPLTAGPSDHDSDSDDGYSASGSGSGFRSGWPKANASASTSMVDVGAQLEDQPELRKTIRAWCAVPGLLSLAVAIMSIVAGSNYRGALDNGSHASLVRSLWYACDTLGVVLLVGIAATAVFAYVKLPRVPRASLLWIIVLALLLATVGIYRITVLTHSTTSLFSMAPGGQNTPREKAAFYVFHVAPEFIVAAVLMALNVRRVFGTGPWGDHLAEDPKPKTEAEEAAKKTTWAGRAWARLRGSKERS